MDYGAVVCTARPKCGECVVMRWCASSDRFAAPPTLVAEGRAAYDARTSRTTKPQPKFEESARYVRGRIVDALRALRRGESIAVSDVREAIDAVRGPVDAAEFAGYVTALSDRGCWPWRATGCRYQNDALSYGAVFSRTVTPFPPVRRRDVELRVGVDTADSDGERTLPDGVVRSRLEGAVAIAQQDADRVAARFHGVG